MKTYKLFIVIAIFIILGIQNTQAIPYLTQIGEPMPTKKVVIFDLDGVLFKENKPAFAKKIGISELAKYTIKNWTTPETMCFDTLESISKQEGIQHEIPLTHRGRTMPCCIMEWQLGKKSHIQVRKELADHIDLLATKNHFKNDQEKNLTKRILDISLNPEHLAELTSPVPSMVQLAKQLKANGYRLYLLSNLAREHYEILQKNHPDIAQLFDGIVISAHVNMLKPHKKIYEHVLRHYNLNAQECIFIDNQQENVDAAQACGIDSITHKTIGQTKTHLNKLGIKI